MNPQEPDKEKQAAQSILGVTFSPELRERMEFLAEKARQGKLTLDEESEIDGYERAGHLLSILHIKARRILRDRPDS